MKHDLEEDVKGLEVKVWTHPPPPPTDRYRHLNKIIASVHEASHYFEGNYWGGGEDRREKLCAIEGFYRKEYIHVSVINDTSYFVFHILVPRGLR